MWKSDAAQGLAEIQIQYREEIENMKTGDTKLFVSRNGDNEIVAAVLVFQFDGAEVFSAFENACNGEKRAVAMLQDCPPGGGWLLLTTRYRGCKGRNCCNTSLPSVTHQRKK